MIRSLEILGNVDTAAGLVDVWRVIPAYDGAGSEIVGYAVVVREPAEAYDGPRIPMGVTVHDPSADPGKAGVIAEDPDLVPQGKWDGKALFVGDVYADPAFRGRTADRISPPVAVGQFLHALECFSRQSTVRSEAGDRWAVRVGGELPILLGRPRGDLEGTMRGWLTALADDPRLNAADDA